MADAGYSATPLFKKLGIKSGLAVALVGAPDGFEAQLKGRNVVAARFEQA